jgi:hypothetical protein
MSHAWKIKCASLGHAVIFRVTFVTYLLLVLHTENSANQRKNY